MSVTDADESVEPSKRGAQVVLDDERVVNRRLRSREEYVERRNVDSDALRSEFRALDESCPAAGERVEDDLAGAEVAAQENLDELRYVLAEVGV